jgi:endonuclease YncB( thermonuclease family)
MRAAGWHLGILLASLGLAGCNVIDALPAATGNADHPRLAMCASGRNHDDSRSCVVDGDTIWLDGESLRLESYDTPEPRDNICGGKREVTLAHRASARLLELLNENAWTVQRFGLDPNGRTLATIRIRGEDVGDILIDEGLARRWPDGDEWWCD